MRELEAAVVTQTETMGLRPGWEQPGQWVYPMPNLRYWTVRHSGGSTQSALFSLLCILYYIYSM